MVNGVYYYVGQNEADNLRAVTFDGDGNVASEAIACPNFAGSPGPRFIGDPAYDAGTGVIYDSARIRDNIPPTAFFSINPATCEYDAISDTGDQLQQLAFDCEGDLIRHDTSTGRYVVVDPATGNLTANRSRTDPDIRMNDLDVGICEEPGIGDGETAWCWRERFRERGNWARYFTFTPWNHGSVRIAAGGIVTLLAASLSGPPVF